MKCVTGSVLLLLARRSFLGLGSVKVLSVLLLIKLVLINASAVQPVSTKKGICVDFFCIEMVLVRRSECVLESIKFNCRYFLGWFPLLQKQLFSELICFPGCCCFYRQFCN